MPGHSPLPKVGAGETAIRITGMSASGAGRGQASPASRTPSCAMTKAIGVVLVVARTAHDLARHGNDAVIAGAQGPPSDKQRGRTRGPSNYSVGIAAERDTGLAGARGNRRRPRQGAQVAGTSAEGRWLLQRCPVRMSIKQIRYDLADTFVSERGRRVHVAEVRVNRMTSWPAVHPPFASRLSAQGDVSPHLHRRRRGQRMNGDSSSSQVISR